jgi:hypothetical protein
MTVGFWKVEKVALIYLYQELKNLAVHLNH